MYLYEHNPTFPRECNDYLQRQQMLPTELTSQLEELVQQPDKFMPLNHQIFGLCVGRLYSANGSEEHVLAVMQKYPTSRFVVFIAILNGSIEEVKAECNNPIWKRKINIAVGRLIAMSRFGNGWGPAKEA